MRKKEGLDAKVGSNLPIFCGIVVIVSSGGDNHRSVEKLLRPSIGRLLCWGDQLRQIRQTNSRKQDR